MRNHPSNDLPAPLDLLWGTRERKARKEGLSLEAIVKAAVDLADSRGLESLSMSRVAERLGFTTMSLYRYVQNKDELIALMVEAATSVPAVLDDPPPSWRAGLERWTWELLKLVRRHPWILEVPLARLPFGPNRLTWLDRGLRALMETPLSGHEKANVLLLLNGVVFGEARLAAEIGGGTPERGDAGEATPDPAEALATVADAERFPALRQAAIDAGLVDLPTVDRDADFAFGLERILDGIERLVDQRRGLPKRAGP